jgi:3D-(3,5/4)-trihydroxycyclohexane-1,2-dione acylhydrolase (decyclizing)
VLGESADFPRRFFEPRVWPVVRRPPAERELDGAERVLGTARRPLIIAGGGVRHSAAERALAAFAEATGIPVAETSAGKGVMSPGPLCLGGIGVNGTGAANRIAERADAVLCVGTRLTDFTTGSRSVFQDPGVRFVAVNVSAADAHKLSASPIVADARLALAALAPRVAPVARAYRDEVADTLRAWEAELAADLGSGSSSGMNQGEVYAALNAAAEPGDWVVAAAGWAPGDLLKVWRVPPDGHAHLEFGYSCMGHEIPAALGIRLHDGPGAEILVVIGDGTFLMAPTELVTAVQEGLKLTVVVLDNGAYGSIDQLALAKTGVSVGNRFERRDGTPVGVDHAAVAESLGCRGVRADDVAALAQALAEARAVDATTVIHCPTVPGRPLIGSGAFWDLGVPETAADGEVREPAERHLRERAERQRRL